MDSVDSQSLLSYLYYQFLSCERRLTPPRILYYPVSTSEYIRSIVIILLYMLRYIYRIIGIILYDTSIRFPTPPYKYIVITIYIIE